MSPLKLSTWLSARNEKTVVEPFGPLYRLQEEPAMVTDATGVALPSEPYVPGTQSQWFQERTEDEHLLEIGPAPPRAASQIIISYSFDPPADDEVNRS